MKTVFKWAGKILLGVLMSAVLVLAAALIMPVMILLLCWFVFLVAILFDDSNGLPHCEDAVTSLRAAQLSAYEADAPHHITTVDDSMLLFDLIEYDNLDESAILRQQLLKTIAATDGWHVKSLSPAEYAARIPAEAAFLLPDATFDAWFESAEDTSFFDQETGLFIHLRTGEAPKPGSVRANGLTIPHNGYLYEMETHGGFHGDGSTYYALIVPEEKRPALEKALAAHADWHMGDVPHAEYRVMHDKLFFQVLPLYPAADVDFEWCSFVDTYARMYPEEATPTPPDARFPAAMQEIGACWSMNWLAALYDPDTGLFIYYEHDT